MVTRIIRNGGKAYSKISTPKSLTRKTCSALLNTSSISLPMILVTSARRRSRSQCKADRKSATVDTPEHGVSGKRALPLHREPYRLLTKTGLSKHESKGRSDINRGGGNRRARHDPLRARLKQDQTAGLGRSTMLNDLPPLDDSERQGRTGAAKPPTYTG